MLYFCTIFDSNYFTRGMTMYKSLVRHCPSFHLYIVCLDEYLFNYLKDKSFSNIYPVRLTDIENKYPELSIAKSNREYVEYIFTLSPFIGLYILDQNIDIEIITTMDADLYFFSDPTPIVNSISKNSIAITPHNFKSSLSKHTKYGKYNVSFQTFRRDDLGVNCLNKWKDDCIDWCYDKFENNKFADQKYLDYWKDLYSDVVEYPNNCGVAPWNIDNKLIKIGNEKNVKINNESLIYYHFHGLRNVNKNIYSIGLIEYLVGKRKNIMKFIYEEYIEQLNQIEPITSNNIKRRTHLQFGRIFYLFFMTDLYIYSKGKLINLPNLNFVRFIYSFIKSKL